MLRMSVRLILAACLASSLSFPIPSYTLFGSSYLTSQGPSTLFSLSTSNGVATSIGVLQSGGSQLKGIGAMDRASDGTLYGAAVYPTTSDSSLIKINSLTGAATIVGPMNTGGNVQDMSFRPSDGKLFLYSDGSIFTVNTTTGAATLVGDTGSFPDGNALVFSGSTLYLANNDTAESGGCVGEGGVGGPAPGIPSAQGELWVVNQTNGSLTPSVALTFAPGFGTNNVRINAMKYDQLGTLWVSVQAGSRGGPGWANFLGTLNTTTGVVSLVAPTTPGLDGIAFALPAAVPGPPSAVPALSDWALFGTALALAGLGILAQRIRRGLAR